MPWQKGKFIVIEGLEGAGKSSAVKIVLDDLSQRSIPSITTREPGGTAIGELLRNIIKNPEYSEVLQDKTELLLLYAARLQLIEQVIKPALEEGYWVIADRFELSTLAYQGGGRCLDKDFIQQLSQFSLNGFKPDLTLYLDISPELGLQRAQLRGALDRIEQQTIDFFHRVNAQYKEKIKNNPKVVIIDASLSLEDVTMAIRKHLELFIKQVR